MLLKFDCLLEAAKGLGNLLQVPVDLELFLNFVFDVLFFYREDSLQILRWSHVHFNARNELKILWLRLILNNFRPLSLSQSPQLKNSQGFLEYKLLLILTDHADDYGVFVVQSKEVCVIEMHRLCITLQKLKLWHLRDLFVLQLDFVSSLGKPSHLELHLGNFALEQLLPCLLLGFLHVELLLNWLDLWAKLLDSLLLLFILFNEGTVRLDVKLNELVQLYVTVVVLITLPENFINDFSTVSQVSASHFEECKHLWFVDSPIPVVIELLELLLQLDLYFKWWFRHFKKY